MNSFLALPKSKLRIAYHDCGSGPVLFFVHGVSESGFIWKYAVNLLREKFRCITIDLPGHGESHRQRGSFSMSFYSDIVLECLDALGLHEVIYCGHSMGGQVGIITALRAPARISKLVLINSAGLEKFTAPEKQMLAGWAEKTYSDPDYAAQLRQTLLAHFIGNPARGEELLHKHTVHADPKYFHERSVMLIASIKGMLDEPVYDFLPALRIPVCILYGNPDLVIPNRWLHPQLTTDIVFQDAAKNIPGARIAALPNCGHYAPFENPELFVSGLRQMLR
ncbi:MAG: acetoin dehydrogenase E2 subunit [Bacteroidetes bacterium]|nr:MAG: acetoin dehydrogenase E2 subunit [Bacteroidota bacterium]